MIKKVKVRNWRDRRKLSGVAFDDERRQTQKAEFIRVLKITGNVSKTCDALGIPRSNIYRWKEEDQKFREQWIEARFTAKDNLIEMLEDAAIERALSSSDALLKFLLQHLYPERYREEQVIEHKTPMIIWDLPIPKEAQRTDGDEPR